METLSSTDHHTLILTPTQLPVDVSKAELYAFDIHFGLIQRNLDLHSVFCR